VTTPADIIKQMEKRYRTIDDITVTFRQSHSLRGDGDGAVVRRQNVHEEGNKYRIELEDQTIVTDGSSVWSYSKVTIR
jgi:outer membrane lipoprotein-sorting protein